MSSARTARQLASPHAARGARLAPWEWERAASEFSRAYELGEEVGRSEVAFSALYWLAVTKRETDDLGGPETELSRALDICERAGLIAQSVEAISGRAIVLALAGRTEQARTAAEEAVRLSERIHYPVGDAATAEASGACEEDPAHRADELLRGARERWAALGRPLDAARCTLIHGRVLATTGTRPHPLPSSARPLPNMRRWACPGSPVAPASWSPRRWRPGASRP